MGNVPRSQGSRETDITQWRIHPITMLMNHKRMFKTVLFKILPSKSDACVFSGTVSGDLFCSFAWAMFSFFLAICYLKLGIKKISHLSQSLQTGRQHLHQLAGQVLSLEISLAWKFEVFSGLFWTCVFPGPVYCSISVTSFKCLHFLEYNPCFFLDLLCFIMLPNQ